MGLTQSASDNVAKKYTDAEIRQNIQKLFVNNRENNFSEASYSIRDLENMVVSDGPFFQSNNAAQLGGQLNNIKFKSSKNRHLNHNINEYISMFQKGGNVYENTENTENTENSENNYHGLSNISEFQKIKEFLVNDNSINSINSQNGGQQFGTIIDSVSSVSHNNKLTFFDALKQITQNGGVDTSDSDDDVYTDSDDSDDDINYSDDSDDIYTDDGLSSTSSEIPNNTNSFSDTSYSRMKSSSSNSTFSATSSTMPKYSGKISDTSYSQSNAYSITSNDTPKNSLNISDASISQSNSASSELNIVPFYSSSESDMRHPYIKNRFN